MKISRSRWGNLLSNSSCLNPSSSDEDMLKSVFMDGLKEVLCAVLSLHESEEMVL
jgi:hypothetical protein